MNILWSPTVNYAVGRNGYRPIAIVNHITAGLMPGSLAWLQNPSAQASSHFIVDRLGVVYQLVKEEDTAWGNGLVSNPTWPLLRQGINPNLYTLSIEHEGYPGEPLTEVQYQSSLALQQMLCDKWDIPRDRDHIIGHYQIDSVNRPNCPGSLFPWERLMHDLAAVRVRIDGNFVPLYTKLEDGRTLVHVRIAEYLGYNVAWDGQQYIVDLKKS